MEAKSYIEDNMKIRLIHSITIVIVFFIRIFCSHPIQNISDNFKKFFNFHFDDMRHLTYFFLGLSIFLNIFLIKKNKVIALVYCLLILANTLLIFFSVRLW